MQPEGTRTRTSGDAERGPVALARLCAALVAGALVLSACSSGTVGAGGPAAGPAGTPSASPTSEVTPEAPDDEPSEPAPSPTPTSTPTPTPTPPAPEPAPEPEPEPTTQPEPEPEPSEPAPLRHGDEGEAVLALQSRLIELGYFLPAADGDFGGATQQAVWALQKAAGLDRDGLVGPATQAALDAGTRPAPRSTSGRVIEVDLTAQLLLAVDDGVVTRIVNASSGNGESYQALGRWLRATTPRGDYTVVRQIDGTHESSLELGAMYRPKYFHKGWAVHGSSSIPPWPASHGCVRVSNSAMNWIWDVWGAPIGTRLLVY